MGNRISERVADFLGRYPPFDEFTERDLHALAYEVDIQYRKKGGPPLILSPLLLVPQSGLPCFWQ